MSETESQQLPMKAVLPVVLGRNEAEETRDGQLYLPQREFGWLDVPEPYFSVVPGVPSENVKAHFPSTDTTEQLFDIRPTLHCVSAERPHRYTLCNVQLRGSPSITFSSVTPFVGPSRYWIDTAIEGAYWTEQDLAELTSVALTVPTTNGILPVETPWASQRLTDEPGAIVIPAVKDLNEALPRHEDIPVEFTTEDKKGNALLALAVRGSVGWTQERFQAQTELVLSATPRAGSSFDLAQVRRLVTTLHGFLRFCTGHQVNPIDYSVSLGSRHQAPRRVLGPFWQYEGPSSAHMNELSHFPVYPPVVGWWREDLLPDLLRRWFRLSIKHPSVAPTFRSRLFLPDPKVAEDSIATFRERILLLETMRPRDLKPIVPNEIYEEHIGPVRRAILKDPRIEDDARKLLLSRLGNPNEAEISLRHHIRNLTLAYPKPLHIAPGNFHDDASRLRHATVHHAGRSPSHYERAYALNPYVLLTLYVRILEEMSFDTDEVARLLGTPERSPYWLGSGFQSESPEEVSNT
jgi:hypothetical protein